MSRFIRCGFLVGLSVFLLSETHALTFEWETATDNGGNVTETISGVEAEFSGSGALIDNTLDGVDGLSGNIVANGNADTAVFIAFDRPIDITTIRVYDYDGFDASTWSFTDFSAEGNTTVTQAIPTSPSQLVTLNWTNVTLMRIHINANPHFFAVDEINFTIPNADPEMVGIPSDVTVIEDIASDLDLSATFLSDADGDTVTLTLAAGSGTMTASSGGGVTIGGSGTGTLTLLGTTSNINTYLNTASNVQYTGASNVNGNDATTLSITANDGAGSGDVNLGTVNIDITAVDDPPTTSDSAVATDEDTTYTFAFDDFAYSDVDGDPINGIRVDASTITGNGVLRYNGSEIVADGSFSDATLLTYEPDGVNGETASFDFWVLNAQGNSATTETMTINVAEVNDSPFLAAIDDIVLDEGVEVNITSIAVLDDSTNGSVSISSSVEIGFFTLESSGILTLGGSGGSSPTISGSFADINAYLSVPGNLTYTAPVDSGGVSSITITVTAEDSSAASDAENFNIDINDLNNEPTLTATGSDPTFTEGGAAASLYSGASASTIESGQTITALTLTVTNVNDGSNEILNADGTAIALTNGNSGTTATNSLSYSVSVSGTTATISLSGGTVSTAATQTLINGMSYQNNSSTPDTTNRVVTITSITDSGSNVGANDNVASLAIASTITVVGINTPPTLTATSSDPTFTEGGAAVGLFSGSSASTIEAAQTFSGLLIQIHQRSPLFVTFEDEFMTIDGGEIELGGDTTNGTTDNFDYVMGLYQSNKVRIYLSNGAIDSATLNTLIDNLAYRHAGAPDGYDREVSIFDLTDSGGTANGGDDSADLGLLSTVSFDVIPDLVDADETPGETTAVITWETSEIASTQLEYGIADVTENTTAETDTAPRVTDHTVNLSSLLPCTTYLTRLHSTDGTGNELIGPTRSFTTTGCDTDATVEDSVMGLIDEASDTVVLTSGGNSITASKAAGDDVYVNIRRLNTTEFTDGLGQPSGKFIFGDQSFEIAIYSSDLSARVTTTDAPITIVWEYDPANLGGIDENTLDLHHWTGAAWEGLGCIVDAGADTLTCTSTSFSPVGGFGSSPTTGGGGGAPTSHSIMMCSYETGKCTNVMPYRSSPTYGIYRDCLRSAGDGYDCAQQWALANNYVTVETFNANPRQVVQEEPAQFHASAEDGEIIPLFGDLDTSHPAYEAIYWMAENDIVTGYPDGTFKPDNSINRVEFLKIALLAAGVDENLLCRRYFPYSDVDPNAWYVNYVQKASCASAVQGYPDQTFRPANTINFVEGAKIAVLTLGFDIPEVDGPWYAPYVSVLEQYDAVPASISDNAQPLTRGEMAQIVWKLMQ